VRAGGGRTSARGKLGPPRETGSLRGEFPPRPQLRHRAGRRPAEASGACGRASGRAAV